MNHPVLPRYLSFQLQCCGVDSSEDFSLAVEFIKYTNEANAGQVVPEVRNRSVTIPALDPALESDVNSFWDIQRFRFRIRIQALMIRIHL